jgi:hypothetical protein
VLAHRQVASFPHLLGQVDRLTKYDEIALLRANNYSITAVVCYEESKNLRCMIKMINGSLEEDSIDNLLLVNIVRKNEKWYYELLDKSPMRSVTLLALKNSYAAQIFTTPTLVAPGLQNFLNINSNDSINFSKIGQSILNKINKGSNNSTQVARYCNVPK